MKVIEIKDFTPPSGSEFNASAYPSDGAFLSQNGSLYFVLSGAVSTHVIPGIRNLIIEKPNEAPFIESSAITGDVLLKAIALAQDPALAVTLLKQQQ